jgi:type IV pilus assembly protein PilE
MKTMLTTHIQGAPRQRGVTLIELITVTVVIAILASIAVPSYRQYLLRSQRSEAKAALLQLQTAQEKFYMQNNFYSLDITTAAPDGLGLRETTETGKYELSVAIASAGQRYVATATPAGGQVDDSQCTEYSIDERGRKYAEGDQSDEFCWR